MKIVFYAPDSALPKDFSTSECEAFRAYAAGRLDVLAGMFQTVEASVSAEGLIDPSAHLVTVEGGTPDTAAILQTYCAGLLVSFLPRRGANGADAPLGWTGGFFKWAGR